MEVQNTPQQTTQIQSKSNGETAINLFLDQRSLLTQYGASLTISDTLTGPDIKNLVKTNGEGFVGVFVIGVLKEFLNYVPNSLTPEEVVQYADSILSFCPDWGPNDLILCLKNGASGKYGPVQYHWKWNPNFITWVQKYNQEKADFFYKRHEEKKKEGAKTDQLLVSMLPKDLLEKFKKEPFIDQKKRDRAHVSLNIPNEIIEQGVEAVDAWIEKYKLNKQTK